MYKNILLEKLNISGSSSQIIYRGAFVSHVIKDICIVKTMNYE